MGSITLCGRTCPPQVLNVNLGLYILYILQPLNAREQAHHKAPLIRIDPITNTIVPVNATADGQNAVMSYGMMIDWDFV